MQGDIIICINALVQFECIIFHTVLVIADQLKFSVNQILYIYYNTMFIINKYVHTYTQ